MENSNFISSAEWYRSLNVWIAKLWNRLLKIDPSRYVREQTFTGDGSTQDFEVATDYYGTVGIDYVSDATSGVYVSLRRVNGSEENRFTQTEQGIPLAYTFRYNNTVPSTPLIRILPVPDTVSNCRHRYTVVPQKLATDGTDSAVLIAGIAGLEEFVVIGMSIDAKVKEGSSAVQLRESMAEMTAELEEAAENRSIDSAGQVQQKRTLRFRNHFDPASIRWGGK